MPSGYDKRHRFPLAALSAMLILASIPDRADAGPPYLNDDPQPTDVGHWEIYNFVAGAHGTDDLEGEAGLDLNYGAAKDLQLTAVLPLAFQAEGDGLRGLRGGPGDVELAVKYRFLHQSEGGWTPDVSFFPRVFLPTAGRQFGAERVNVLLPFWAQKDSGPWSVFGGGGYQINPGPGRCDFWQGGVAVTRDITKRLNIGAEAFAQTRDASEGGGYRALNFAVVYKLVEHWSLLASAGPTWEDGGGHGQVFYLSLKADY